MKAYLEELTALCQNTLVDNLGMEFTACGEGWLEARMPIDRRTCRPDGALHGGANMALAETVGGALSSMSVPRESCFRVFGIEVNGNHMKQAQGRWDFLSTKGDEPMSYRWKSGMNSERW